MAVTLYLHANMVSLIYMLLYICSMDLFRYFWWKYDTICIRHHSHKRIKVYAKRDEYFTALAVIILDPCIYRVKYSKAVL